MANTHSRAVLNNCIVDSGSALLRLASVAQLAEQRFCKP
jgi:hypothetical protein